MESYNPSKDINTKIWLAMDENERQVLIEEYVLTHENEIEESALFLHASAHLIVENQIALGEKDTVDAFLRLKRQGLKRHDTIHAIAAVIMENIYEALQNEDEKFITSNKSRLRKLTAKRWLKGNTSQNIWGLTRDSFSCYDNG